MDEAAYDFESAAWYDIENNKMHLKKDGDHYVADAMLFRENANLRQENDSLRKENDSLRKERNHWHVEQVHAYGNWEDAHKRASELEAENDKLRELVCRYVEYTSQYRCEGCVFKSRCNDGEVDECWQLTEIRGLARELGIEI